MAFKRGKHKETGGNFEYSLDDSYNVFKSIANTPTYHKQTRNEMMARLDNFGPFQVCFMISCADYRWKENLVTVLRE